MSLSEPEREELIERRLTERVCGSVELTLKRRYAWVVAVLFAVGGIGGWALLTSKIEAEIAKLMKEELRPTIEQAQQVRVEAAVAQDQVASLRGKAAEALDEIKRLNDQTQALTKQVNDQIAALNEQFATIGEQVASLGVRLRTTQEATQQVERIRRDVEDLSSSVQDLSTTTREVASRTNVPLPQPRSAPAFQSSTTKTGPDKRPTVYLQVSGRIAPDKAEQIAYKLREDGFEVPGVDRASSTVREVRFFYSEDKQLAEHLAANTRSILQDAGFLPADVGIRDLTYWQRAKPPKATVELWLNID